MHHDACVTDMNILIVGFVVNKFQLNILKQKRLNEISKNKFPSKITRYMVPYMVCTLQLEIFKEQSI